MTNSVAEKAVKNEINDILQDTMLDEGGKQGMADEMAQCAEIKGRFWVAGDVQTEDGSMILRPVRESDREGFI